MEPAQHHLMELEAGTPPLGDALSLVWQVFLEYEAPDYPPAGVETFKAYISAENIEKQMRAGALRLWACTEAGAVVGVVAIRPPCHVSLLFVAGSHHRRGIARALYRAGVAAVQAQGACAAATVNASPYAVDAYRHMGFVPTGGEQLVDGLRFTPMQHVF